MKLRIETFRDSSSRLRAKLFCDGRLVSVKPAERVCDGAPQEERHQYNLFKLFGLYFPDMPAEDRLRLLAGEEVEPCISNGDLTNTTKFPSSFFLSSGIATHNRNISKLTSCYIINVVKMAIKIKVTEITIFDLLKEAFSIPDGWKEEVYVEDGYVTFSSPMTQSTHTGIDAYTPLPEYVADLQSFRIGDFEGFNEREDGSIEADGEILTREEAIDAIATTYEEDYQPNSRDANSDPILQLYYDLLHPRAIFKDGVVRCERCGVEIWEDAECDCGVDGSDHEGLDEAYANKREAE